MRLHSLTGDFSGMDGIPKWIYLHFARHKAFVSVDEQGTEAAAVTIIGGGGRGYPETPKIRVYREQAVHISDPRSRDGNHPVHGPHPGSVEDGRVGGVDGCVPMQCLRSIGTAYREDMGDDDMEGSAS